MINLDAILSQIITTDKAYSAVIHRQNGSFLPCIYPLHPHWQEVHFLLVFPHLWLAVGGDRGKQVQYGQDSPWVDDHHVRWRGESGVGRVG